MTKKIYLAAVNGHFELSEFVRAYFEEQQIEIQYFYKNLGILKIASMVDLEARSLKYISKLEKDSEVMTSDSDQDTEQNEVLPSSPFDKTDVPPV